jgi:sulfatase modifying factor 1
MKNYCLFIIAGITFWILCSYNIKAQNIDIQMVSVTGGTFQMGICTYCNSSFQEHVHTVKLSSFSIGKYEITQKQWAEIMGTTPSWQKNCDNCPVEQISYNDVQQFLTKLNIKTGKKYRLPTEAEWEYAARGGNKSKGFEYSGSKHWREVSWYDDNSDYVVHPVGQKIANELGIYDMSGNVREWCNDWYDGDYYKNSPVNNPQGPNPNKKHTYLNRHVIRGGSWYGRVVDGYVSARSCGNYDLTYNYKDLGFRVVLSE